MLRASRAVLVGTVAVLLGGWPFSAQGAIPEPDAVIHGDFLDAPAPAGTRIEARYGGTSYGSHEVGATPASSYVLRLPLETPTGEAERSAGKLWANDEIAIYVVTDSETAVDTTERFTVARGVLQQINLNSDGSPTSVNPDLDGDGVLNENDAFPNDPTEQVDTDGDGIGNNADTDDDGDHHSDEVENTYGTDPLDPSSTPLAELPTFGPLGQLLLVGLLVLGGGLPLARRSNRRG